MTPAKTPSNNRFVAWSDHLLWSGKTLRAGSGLPIQPHNLRLIVFPAYGMNWGNVMIERVANQLLV